MESTEDGEAMLYPTGYKGAASSYVQASFFMCSTMDLASSVLWLWICRYITFQVFRRNQRRDDDPITRSALAREGSHRLGASEKSIVGYFKAELAKSINSFHAFHVCIFFVLRG